MKVIVAMEAELRRAPLVLWLRESGYEVVEVDDAYRTIEAVEKNRTSQLVILDWNLPGLNGAQVCHQTSRTEQRWRSYLVVIAEEQTEDERTVTLNQGADACLIGKLDWSALDAGLKAGVRALQRLEKLLKTLQNDRERYIALEAIGSGGLGKVYRGMDRRLEREVAIKFLKADVDMEGSDAQAALNEARLLARFHHPNLVTVFDCGENEEGAFIVMEVVEGESLQSMLSGGPISMELFSLLVVQSLKGIGAAHSLGILHLDLKPSNMMFGFVGATGVEMNLKVLDFGLARARKSIKKPSLASHSIFGSMPYLSPERLKGESVDRRTDLYALGHIYYEALTGRHAFQGEDPNEILQAHLTQIPEPIEKFRPEVSPALAKWVLKLMEKSSKERPSTAEAALHAYLKLT